MRETDRRGVRRAARTIALLLLSTASTGCLSLGYGLGHASAKVDTRIGNSSNLEYIQQVDSSTMYQQFRVIDSTGLLLAGLVNTSRQAEARSQAMDRAAAGGAKVGDKVEYSYEAYGLLPGPRITADLRLGLGPGSTTFTGAGGVRYEAANYAAFDVGGEPMTFASADNRFVAGFGAAMLLEMWGLRNGVIGYDHEHVSLDVFLSGKAGYLVRPDLTVTGKAYVGVVSPIMALLVGAPGGPGLSLSTGIEAAYQPNPLVSVVGDLTFALPVWLDLPLRGGFIGRAGVNVVFNLEGALQQAMSR